MESRQLIKILKDKNIYITAQSNTTVKVKGKGHPITGHEGPTGGVEV
jgi:hypothetical protein